MMNKKMAKPMGKAMAKPMTKPKAKPMMGYAKGGMAKGTCPTCGMAKKKK